jgi:hypothetical protein
MAQMQQPQQQQQMLMTIDSGVITCDTSPLAPETLQVSGWYTCSSQLWIGA